MNQFNNDNSITIHRRVKERLVGEVIDRVNQWKMIILNGFPQSDGTIKRLTLNKAAEIIGIPKKSLEDYNQLFKKVKLLTDINQFVNEKMGVLRNYVRKNSKKLKKILKTEKVKQNKQNKKQNKKGDLKIQPDINQVEKTSENGQDIISNQQNYQRQEETSMIKLEEEFDFLNNVEKEYESDLESNPSPLGVNFIFRNKQTEYLNDFDQF